MIFLNAFPKAGLHLALAMVNAARPNRRERGWACSFDGGPWTADPLPVAEVLRDVGRLRPGALMRGHMGYYPEVNGWLVEREAAIVFVYRDLRDVLVSQAHHLADRPGFEGMDEEARLLACLNGAGDVAGLFDRWPQYAGWINAPGTLTLRYEDLLAQPEESATVFLRYLQGQREGEARTVAAMVERMGRTDLSPTFRRGIAGGWREAFTPAVEEAFTEAAGDWLVRLGYEDTETEESEGG